MQNSIRIFLVILMTIATLVRSTPQQGLQEVNVTDGLISSVFSDPLTKYESGVIDLHYEPDSPTGCPFGSECVRYFQCRDNFVDKDGSGIFEKRFSGKTRQECSHYLETCCRTGEISHEPIIQSDPAPKGCGFRNENGAGMKIIPVRDHEAQFGEFPWMVAVLQETKIENTTANLYMCGGSLIHPGVVLTAAHCLHPKSPSTLKIRAGEWDTQTEKEIYPHQDRQVAEIVFHDRFNPRLLHNDIALLFLERPVDLAPNVKTVCLPSKHVDLNLTRCFASGWGKDVYGKDDKYQVILKKIDLPIIPRSMCESTLRTTRLGQHFKLDSSFICAGGEKGKDTCKGDGGSALVCPIEGRKDQYHQIGIVAWGIGCGSEIPGAYANVPELRSWIDEKLTSRSIDSKFYTA